jgi:ribosome-binding factor A
VLVRPRESNQLEMSPKTDRRGAKPRRERQPDHALPLETLFFKQPSGRSGPRQSNDNKARQLCRQVQRRLDLALAELDDPILQGLWISSVVQEPGGRALLVEVIVPDLAAVTHTYARLEAARGHLRCEVAAAISRKRTPHLQFVVVPQTAVDPTRDREEDEP